MEEGAGLYGLNNKNLEASPRRFIPCAPTMLGKAGASGKIIESLCGCNPERSKNGFKAKGFTSLRIAFMHVKCFFTGSNKADGLQPERLAFKHGKRLRSGPVFFFHLERLQYISRAIAYLSMAASALEYCLADEEPVWHFTRDINQWRLQIQALMTRLHVEHHNLSQDLWQYTLQT